jgi:heptosyltransferase I
MRIAIVKLSALGDIVHAMVVLQYIKKYNKEILIDWIVEEDYGELLKYNPNLNQIHVVNLKKAKNKKSLGMLFNDMRKLRALKPYDVVFDLQGLIKSAIISRIVPSKSTLGFDNSSAREGLASLFYSKTFKIGYEENIVKRNFELIRFGLNLPFIYEDLKNKSPFIIHKQEYFHSTLSSTKKNILIIPGASHASKIYPANKFAKITQMIEANFIIIWGNQSERKMADEIKSISKMVKISEKLSLNILASLIGKVDLVIGADTGPTHIAWALNIPSIILFGSTPGYRNTVASEINLIIESKSIVNPLKIDKTDETIKEIKVEDILQIATKLLGRKTL